MNLEKLKSLLLYWKIEQLEIRNKQCYTLTENKGSLIYRSLYLLFLHCHLKNTLVAQRWLRCLEFIPSNVGIIFNVGVLNYFNTFTSISNWYHVCFWCFTTRWRPFYKDNILSKISLCRYNLILNFWSWNLVGVNCYFFVVP